MRIVDLSQRSPAWCAWRAQGVTASEAAIVLGRSPYQTPWRLWAEKTGLCPPPDLTHNPFVRRGVQCEDQARQGFEARHQTWLLPVCAESSDHPVLRCSFDGLTETGEPVELKVPGDKIWAEVARQGRDSPTYRLYWVQVQFQCYVAQAERGWLVFDPVKPKIQPLEFEVRRDADFIAQELVPGCLRFAELVTSGEAPTPDPPRDHYVPSGAQRLAWQQQATAYRQAAAEVNRLDAALRSAKERLSEVQSGLVALMGDYLLADQDGMQVLRYRQRGSVDYPAVLAEIAPDLDPRILEAHRRPATTRVKVTLAGADATSGETSPSATRRRRRKADEPQTDAAVTGDSSPGPAGISVGYF